MTIRDRRISLGLPEAVCLTLIVQGVDHGWAIGGLLAPEGEIGRVWSLSRPLTYRAVERLVELQLVDRTATSGARGRERAVLRATAAGRRASTAWLDLPVGHPRDLRTELLLKLVLRQRGGAPPGPLLDAQLEVLSPTLDALINTNPGNDLVALWRQENARAMRRFLKQAAHTADAPGDDPVRPRADVRLSARNQLWARIDTVAHGDVMSSIKAVLPDGQRLTAAITRDAVEELDLAAGDDVVMIVKSTEIMVAKPTNP